MVGTFYTAPSVDAEPFVKVGDVVKEGQTIGIVEAMKLMNEVNAGCSGIVEAIVAENEQMVEYGQVKRGELGIMGTELNSDLAKAMKVDAQRGAFVSQVLPNSSAAKAGIKAGDVITSLNGKPISSFAALRAQVALCR